VSHYQADASTIVKRYVLGETGSLWVESIADPAERNTLSIAEVTRAEVASAFARRVRDGSLTPAEGSRLLAAFASHCTTQYRIVPTDNVVVDLAIDLTQRHPLRAYDAIQLATALAVNDSLIAAGLPPVIFVTADDRLLAAAQAEGLAVDNPNWHP
jgi:predicted nucleic acid-binding protein